MGGAPQPGPQHPEAPPPGRWGSAGGHPVPAPGVSRRLCRDVPRPGSEPERVSEFSAAAARCPAAQAPRWRRAVPLPGQCGAGAPALPAGAAADGAQAGSEPGADRR